MNSLDSRYLRLGDTFAQRFVPPGIYQYTVGVPGNLGDAGNDCPFVIKVTKDTGATSKTHYVTVLFTNGSFGVDRESVEIHMNDVVLWSTTAADAPGFAVCGLSENARFDSAELRENSMYSHAFGLSGEIEWMDAHECQLNGTVIVQDHRCHTNDERGAYLEKLRKPTLVMIDAGCARPSKVEIATGQTVFFAIRAADGISIVDRRLLDAANVDLNPQPLPP